MTFLYIISYKVNEISEYCTADCMYIIIKILIFLMKYKKKVLKKIVDDIFLFFLLMVAW